MITTNDPIHAAEWIRQGESLRRSLAASTIAENLKRDRGFNDLIALATSPLNSNHKLDHWPDTERELVFKLACLAAMSIEIGMARGELKARQFQHDQKTSQQCITNGALEALGLEVIPY